MSEGASTADDVRQAIGPGRLVLVVGASGVGKDTLIDLVRQQCKGNPKIVFPLRTVTREASEHEDNRTVTPDAFAHEASSDQFAAWWQAHGHSYGIPRQIEDELLAGRTVVLNVSRTVVTKLRAQHASVVVVQVSAPLDVIAARLTARARSSDGKLTERLAREHGIVDAKPDVVIENIGDAQIGAARLMRIVLGD